MLRVDNLHAHYGSAHVLQGISLEVGTGQIICLLGRNGAGKSSTLKAIMGVLRPSSGTITFKGARIDGLSPHAIAARGLAWVPEDRRVFASLSVEENIRVAAQALAGPSVRRMADALAFFPELKARRKQRAGSLSGGQQQMLTMARALASGPQLIMLDEPTEGLAPMVVELICLGIRESCARGVSILLVEQSLSVALALADVFYIISRGAIVYRGTREEIASTPEIVRTHLGVGQAKGLSGLPAPST
jgi:branched-chain amino acid transport system ATP-binding protein